MDPIRGGSYKALIAAMDPIRALPPLIAAMESIRGCKKGPKRGNLMQTLAYYSYKKQT